MLSGEHKPKEPQVPPPIVHEFVVPELKCGIQDLSEGNINLSLEMASLQADLPSVAGRKQAIAHQTSDTN